ncbi:MAG: type II toxin-antitoxin system VapC family toxin [Rhodopila sp.]
MTAIAIDTSAIIAILRHEADREVFVDAVLAASPRFMSAVSLQEASMIIAGRRGDAAAWQPLDELLSWLRIEIVSQDERLARIARDALVRFGKGCHSASLNLGDCAAYALAHANELPLLFKGKDFAQTGIRPALSAA